MHPVAVGDAVIGPNIVVVVVVGPAAAVAAPVVILLLKDTLARAEMGFIRFILFHRSSCHRITVLLLLPLVFLLF